MPIAVDLKIVPTSLNLLQGRVTSTESQNPIGRAPDFTYATLALMNAASPTNGVFAYVLATQEYFERVAGVWVSRGRLTSKPPISAGLGADDTVALQAMYNAAGIGGVVEIPNRDFTFTTLTIPAGVTTRTAGGRLVGGVIRVLPSVSQEIGASFEGMWFKMCRFIFEATSGNVNGIHFKKCKIDGTNLANAGTTSGSAIFIGQNAFDIHLENSLIYNYGYSGVEVQAFNPSTSLPYLAAGVFCSITSGTKIFNIGYAGNGTGTGAAIRLNGASLDGSSIHLSDLLLDHCGYGIYANNFPRLTGAGELIVLGQNVRIELCDQNIYNSGAMVQIDGLWQFGQATVRNGKLVETVNGGYTDLRGRVGNSGGGALTASVDATSACIVEGLLTGPFGVGVRSRGKADLLDNHVLLSCRFRFESLGGTNQKLRLMTVDGVSYGGSNLSNAFCPSFSTGNSEIGTGESKIIYGISGNDTLTIQFPRAILSAVGGAVPWANFGAPLTVDARHQANVYAVVLLRDANGGSAYNLRAQLNGTFAEFVVQVALAL